MATRSNKQGLASDISLAGTKFARDKEAVSALMNKGSGSSSDLLAGDSANRRFMESRRQAEIEARDGNELEFLNVSALKDYIKEMNLEGKLSNKTKDMLDKFDFKSRNGQTADAGDGRSLKYRVDARDLADSIQLDTRHFVAKPLTTLRANDEDVDSAVENLSRFYVGNRVALIATRDDGVKAVIMHKSRGESKFKEGDFIGIDPSNANQNKWAGTVQKVVTFTPQMARKYHGKVEWLKDDYPIERDGTTTLDTTD